MPPLAQMAQQFQSTLVGQSKMRRLIFTAIAIGAVAVALYTNLGGGKGTYAPLVASSSIEDSGAIANYLRAKNVEYRLEDDGVTISVPQRLAAELRMELAQQNLIGGSEVGFEIFEKPPIGMTDRVQEINFLRALQGELARSISTLRPVQRAKVLLALPRGTVFVRGSQNKPSASVVLELAPGARLSPDNVDGILNLVAFSVEGLEKERVALIDSNGKPLTRELKDPSDIQIDQNLAMRENFERDMEANIDSMLERSVGAGQVVTRVHAVFDFKQSQTKTTTYDDEGTLQSEMVRMENIEGGVVMPVGSVGPGISIPGAQGDAVTGSQQTDAVGNGSYTKDTTYLVGLVEQTVVDPAPTLVALTVAVMLDYKEEIDPNSDVNDPTTQKVPYTDEELATFLSLVQNSVGYTPDRADIVSVDVKSVEFTPLDDTFSEVGFESFGTQDFVRNLIEMGIYGLIAALLVLFVARPFLQALGSAIGPALQPLLAAQTAQGPELPAGKPKELPAASGGGSPAEESAPLFTDEEQSRRTRQRAEDKALDNEIQTQLESEPGNSAALIRKWLEEE